MCRFLALLAATCVALRQDTANPRPVELFCSEYAPVAFQTLRGAPEPEGLARRAQGEHNQKAVACAAKDGRALSVCGFLYEASRPVVDLLPDAPKSGQELRCRIVVPGDDSRGRPIEKYTYVWKRFEAGKWVAAKAPDGPQLQAGVTRDSELWACAVRAIAPSGAQSYDAVDQVEIGKPKPGDSRKNSDSGGKHGQWRHCRGYLKFDIGALRGKTIRKARLRLFCDVSFPPFTIHAFAVPDTWNDRGITWVNQPLPFPAPAKPAGSARLDYGPKPTPENPASASSKSTGPEWGDVRAPDWREIDLTGYVRAAAAEGRAHLSVCLAGEPLTQEKYDHSMIHVFGERPFGAREKERRDMRPRLSVETD